MTTQLSHPHRQRGVFEDTTRSGLTTSSAPTVRDVCQTCNNGPLSYLDAYGSKLWRKYFAHALQAPVDVVFDYDYDLLRRWLLKISYNDARSSPNASAIIEAHRPFVPYILGAARHPPSAADVFIGVIHSVEATPDERDAGLPPTWHRQEVCLAHLPPPHREQNRILLYRLISFQSYLFLIVCWNPRVSSPTRKRATREIMRDLAVVELVRRKRRVRIRTSSGDARRYTFEGTFGRRRGETLADWRKR
jgi:hypothetical protein